MVFMEYATVFPPMTYLRMYTIHGRKKYKMLSRLTQNEQILLLSIWGFLDNAYGADMNRLI